MNISGGNILSIQLLLVRWSQKISSNISCTLMTPSFTSLSLLRILFSLLKHVPPFSLTFSAGWTWINCSSIHLSLKFFSSAQNNNILNNLISQINLSAMVSSYSVQSSARNLCVIFESDMYFFDQINSVSKTCLFHIRDIRFHYLLPFSAAPGLEN